MILVDWPIRSQFHFSIHFSSALLLLASSTAYHDIWHTLGLLRVADTCYSCSKQLASLCHHRTHDENNFPVLSTSARFLQPLQHSVFFFCHFIFRYKCFYFTEEPRLSLTAVHLPREKHSPIFTGTSPQLLPKSLPAVMLHHLHFDVNALHKERVEELP